MRINELNMPDAAEPWGALGFTVVDGYIPIGRSFRFKLSDCQGKGVLDITFGDGGRSERTEFMVNAVSAAIEGNPEFLNAPVVQHANSVVGGMKVAIRAADIDDSTARYIEAMPELGNPQTSKSVKTETGNRPVLCICARCDLKHKGIRCHAPGEIKYNPLSRPQTNEQHFSMLGFPASTAANFW